MLSGTNNIPQNILEYFMFDLNMGIFRGILSVPLNIVMDLNNIMHNKITYRCNGHATMNMIGVMDMDNIQWNTVSPLNNVMDLNNVMHNKNTYLM